MKIGNRMINARSETVGEKPAFRAAWKNRRCLIPASGFYEWQRGGKTKQPFVITTTQQPVLTFGGLWERWRSEDQTVLSFCILTTQPNTVMTPIHDRMPVIVEPQDFDRWLGDDSDQLQELLRPCPDSLLDTYPVSTAVNKPANNNSELIRPLSTGIPQGE
jgi:putative SOS response-associated peptidase YedK